MTATTLRQRGPKHLLSMADLDRDDVTGFGPETTTLKNIGNYVTCDGEFLSTYPLFGLSV